MERVRSGWTAHYIDGAVIGGAPPSWLERSYETFEAQTLTEGYPCYFGKHIVRSGDLYVASVEGDRVEELPRSLATFIDISASLRGRRNNLAVFFEPFDIRLAHERYFEIFWHVLQYLHDHDPFPEAIAHRDAEHPRWEFPFAGEQFFVVGASPSYRRRRSRNLGPGMIMLFQPRDVFEHTESGDVVDPGARQLVRRSLAQWDEVGPHPDLGVYGDPGNIEWKQYFLPDGAERVAGRCPLRMRQPQETSERVNQS